MKAHNFTGINGIRYSHTGATVATGVHTYDDIVTCPVTNVKGDFHTPNNWNYTVDRHRYQYGTWFWYLDRAHYLARNPYNYGYGWLGTPVALPTWNRNILYNQALSRVYEKIRGSLDLSIDIAEASQTQKMIRALARWERYLGKWNPRRWANEWLEYQYGWRPLLSDCYDAAHELRRKVEDHELIITGAAKEKLQGFVAQQSVVNVNLKIPHEVKGVAGCKFKLRYKPKANDVARWTSLNPVSIAWELMPYSFVVDWFIDIGGALRSYESSLLYNSYVKGYVDELFAVDVKVNYKLLSGQPATEVYEYSASARRKRVDFFRSVLNSAPSPRLPEWNVSMGWQRWVSAWALSSQVLLGKHKDAKGQFPEDKVPRGQPRSGFP